MPKVPLLTTAYQTRSLIAEAQRCVNLYAEKNLEDAVFPYTYYLTPGLINTKTSPASGVAFRGLYTASWGTLYGVVGNHLYSIDANGVFTQLALIDRGDKPVSMADNGTELVLVSGIPTRTNSGGYQYCSTGLPTLLAETAAAAATSVTTQAQNLLEIGDSLEVVLDSGATFSTTVTGSAPPTYNIANPFPSQASSGNAVTDLTQTASTLSDPGWLGSTRVDYVDTYFLFSKPGTNVWYTSLSGTTSIDPLDYAEKVGGSDGIAGIIAMHDEIWLLGEQKTSEIWYNSGAADFTFAKLPGTFIEHGCFAKHSIAKSDLSIFWLGQDPQGQCVVYMGNSYQAKVISTRAIEYQFQQYPTCRDAIGWTMQFAGHTFYVLVFPSGDSSWLFDLTTGLWTEWLWTDSDGVQHRTRANCFATAYNQLWVGDWENGSLYKLDVGTWQDDGMPIQRIRSWPHLVNDNKRVSYSQFVADLEVGDDSGMLDPSVQPPAVNLSISYDKGKTFGNALQQSLGELGQWLTNVQWRRLGMGRDVVFKLQWDLPCETALNGAFIQVEAAET